MELRGDLLLVDNSVERCWGIGRAGWTGMLSQRPLSIHTTWSVRS